MIFGKNVVFAGVSLQWPRMCHLIVPKIHGRAMAVKTRNPGFGQKVLFLKGFNQKLNQQMAGRQNPES